MSAIRNATDFLEGAGIDIDADADADDCHSTGCVHTPINAPWRGSEREADKTRLFQYIRYEPQGVPIRKVVSDVFGRDVASGDADYQLARRFFARYSDYFKTGDMGGVLGVEPTLGCLQSLNLRQQYARHKTSVQRGGDQTDTENVAKTGIDTIGIGPINAKERTQSYLSNYLQVSSDSVRASLLKQLATDKAGIEDRWQVFKHRWFNDEYLCLPYRTRHSDIGRATAVRDTFETALESAGHRHSDAVVLDLTTDPKAHSGLSEALESLFDNKARLMSWLATDYQLGSTPENMTVLEFTQSGIPHLHVVLFGVSYVVSQAQLSAKWRDLGQGNVVHIGTAKTPHDGTQWRLHDDDRGTVTLEQYFGKAIRELQKVASMSGDELRDRIDSDDISMWRQALYWATERQYVTCSPTLRDTDDADATDNDDNDDNDDESEWQFVGTARYEQIPAHVRQSAVFLKPPPG